LKKVMLVVIAALVTIVAIQFASTASSTPTKQSLSLPKRVARLERQVKVLNGAVSQLAGFAGCLVSNDAPPFGVTRFPSATLPSGGYFDATPQGGQVSYISVRVDPKCLSSSSSSAPKFKFKLQALPR
jgi:hypothetical protein